jgi:hypothetical protein
VKQFDASFIWYVQDLSRFLFRIPDSTLLLKFSFVLNACLVLIASVFLSVGMRCRSKGHAAQVLPREDWPSVQRDATRRWSHRQQACPWKHPSQEVNDSTHYFLLKAQFSTSSVNSIFLKDQRPYRAREALPVQEGLFEPREGERPSQARSSREGRESLPQAPGNLRFVFF